MPRAHPADPDMSLNELMEKWPETIPVFMKHKMICVGCLINPFHTVTDACAEYELSEEAFLGELIAAVNAAGREVPACADR